MIVQFRGKTFGRAPEARLQEAVATEQVTPELQAIDPHDFVTSNEATLYESAEAWRDIIKRAKNIHGEYDDQIRTGLQQSWYETHGNAITDDRLERDAVQLSEKLSIYSLMLLRQVSTNVGVGIVDYSRNIHCLLDGLRAIPDPTVQSVFAQKGFPTKRYATKHAWLVGTMADADSRGARLVGNLTRTYAAQPSELTALATLYEEGAADIDPRYHELKELVATDWYNPAADKSILRRFCEFQRSNPQSHVPGFIELVTDEESANKMQAIQNMAAFALISSGQEITTEGIRTVLVQSRKRWSEIASLSELFEQYVAVKATTVEQAIATIAGPRNPKNLRTYPLPEEVDALRMNFDFRGTISGSRKARRATSRAVEKTVSFKLYDGFAEIREVDPVQTAKRIVTYRRGANNIPITEVITRDQLADNFKITKGNGLEADVKRMIDWLQDNPISPASKQLQPNPAGNKVTYKGKSVRLWRLAPEDCTNIGVHPDNRYWRVVYGITNSDIILVDVMPHDEFTKKYTA